MDQLDIANRLLDLADEDGHFDGCDDGGLRGQDLLDYMGILGVQFTEGSAASEAYIGSLKPLE